MTGARRTVAQTGMTDRRRGRERRECFVSRRRLPPGSAGDVVPLLTLSRRTMSLPLRTEKGWTEGVG